MEVVILSDGKGTCMCEAREYLAKTLVNIVATYVDVASATSASASYSIRVMSTTATKDASTDMSIITFTP